ncbi:MAG: hypothetical protein NZ958_06125 [Bacteroidia bacterium]|nr:hypothetical protein [Bacteroidia bacterium]MDW8088804.1 hypothetical protein [Bacteroidia bacterium]
MWGGVWLSLLWGQTVLAELTLDRRQPPPLRAEYVAADGGLVTLSYKSPTSVRLFALHKYDAELRHEWTQELFDQSTGEEFLHLAVVDTQIWAFTQRTQAQKRHIYAYMLDISGRFHLRQREILVVSAVRQAGTPELAYAPNRRYACLSLPLRLPADSADRIAFFLIGPDTAYAGEWRFPYKERELVVRRSIQPSHEGHLYALATVRPLNEPYPHYYLLRYVPYANLTLSVALEVEGIYLIEPTFRLERGGGARIAAFYSLRRNSSQVQGLVFARVEGSGFFLANVQQVPLPVEVLQRFLSERQIARGRGIPDLYLDHLIPRSNGGALLIGEQFYITTTTFRDFYGFWYTQDTYHYEDIVVFAVDSLGNLEWFRIIPKSQAGTSDTELSYALLVGPRHLYFFYRSYARGTGSQVFVVVLNENGEVSSPRPFLSGFRSTDVFYRKLARQLTNTEGLLAFTRSRSNHFVMMRLALD